MTRSTRVYVFLGSSSPSVLDAGSAAFSRENSLTWPVTMASRINLPFWPSSLGNLSWSADNLIAVGGGELVAILVPRLRVGAFTEPFWNSFTLKVNGFTVEEIDFQNPLSLVNWSLGEEVSLRHVLALGWSPPGLARFGACALGILHSNLVLALWECQGRPELKHDWKRCFIVNHVVQEYYDITDPIPHGTKQSGLEQRRKRQRIRAFSWYSKRPKVSEKTVLVDLCPQASCYLAVSTERGDVLVLRVQSPYNVLSPEKPSWNASVVHRIDCTSLVSDRDWTASLVDGHASVAGQSVLIDGLAWSTSDGDSTASLSFIVAGRLYATSLSFQPPSADPPSMSTSITTETPWQLLQDHINITGPLGFIPKTEKIICFTGDAVLSIDASVTSIQQDNIQRHHLDGRWDEISGLAFTVDGHGQSTVNVTSHLSSAHAITARMSFPFDAGLEAQRPAWQRAINELETEFSAEHDLANRVQVRTWGIASSPLGDHLAVCTLMLPGDSVSHIIQSDQACSVNVTREWYATDTDLLPGHGGNSRPEDISMETLLFSLQGTLGHEFADGPSVSEVTETLRNTIRRVVGQILGLSSAAMDLDDNISSHECKGDLSRAMSCLKHQIYHREAMLNLRVDQLTDLALQRPCNPQLSIEGYRNLVQSILQIAENLSSDGPLSAKICKVHRIVGDRLKARSEVLESFPANIEWQEPCGICQEPMKFEALKWARCARGHRSGRCSLTFLTISQPNASKACRICNAQYLNELTLPELSMQLQQDQAVQEGDRTMDVDHGSVLTLHEATPPPSRTGKSIEPTNSLARVLFATCDRCIICGGKFVS